LSKAFAIPSTRRTFFSSLIGAAIASPTVLRAHRMRITQRELDCAIEQHGLWLSGKTKGTRAAFAGSDLSGLNFPGARETLVDLRGADFTEADLSGVTGSFVSFRHASLHYARLSWSHLVEPAFIDASLRGAICDNVVWGLEAGQLTDAIHGNAKPGAVMFNCDAGTADFHNARIRGHFLGTSFIAASLVDADLSHSTFTGSLQETSFFRADLTRARFDGVEIACARFSQATLAGTQFSRAKFGPRVTLPAHGSVSIIVDQPEVLS
jgi:uncharacterized protein YjbI with pentapeptide repeats